MTKRTETLAEANLRVVYAADGTISKLINGSGRTMFDMATIAAAIVAGDAAVTATVTALATSLATTAFKPTTNTVAPVIGPASGVAGTLVLTVTNNGTWTNTPTSYAYQWQKGGVNIGGQVAISYATVGGDAGSAITCNVTASNAAGPAAGSTASNAVTPSA